MEVAECSWKAVERAEDMSGRTVGQARLWENVAARIEARCSGLVGARGAQLDPAAELSGIIGGFVERLGVACPDPSPNPSPSPSPCPDPWAWPRHTRRTHRPCGVTRGQSKAASTLIAELATETSLSP